MKIPRALFNSLGSNYKMQFALKVLFAGNGAHHRTALQELLEHRYDGEPHLFYKGREAIQAALTIADLPPEAEVLITGYTCFAVYQAVVDARCVPIFVDIAENELNFNADTLKKALQKTPQAKVLILQNTLGFTCDIAAIKGVAKAHGLIIIEDLAHCIGSEYETEQEVGTIGDFTALSFSQDKVVDGVSGGALIVRSKKYQNKAEKLIEYKRLPLHRQFTDRIYPLQTVSIRTLYPFKLGKIQHELAKRLNLLAKPVDGVFGTFRRLPNWYCGLIVDQFKHLPALTRHRLAISEVYAREISEKFQFKQGTSEVVAHLRFPIKVKNRAKLFAALNLEHIYINDVWYESPIAPIRYMSQVNYKKGECAHAEKVAEVMVNLPTHRDISLKGARKLAEKVEAWLLKNEK